MSDSSAFDPFFDPLPEGVHVIEASAGSGKTYAIAQLTLRLVAERMASLPEILIVTFTRAATAELKSRILARLQLARRMLEPMSDDSARPDADPALETWLQTLPDRTAALQAVKRALSEMDRASIFTIDGFVAHLARRFAVEMGLPPALDHVEDDGALDQQLVDRCWQRWLAEMPRRAERVMAALNILGDADSAQRIGEYLRQWGSQPVFRPDMRDRLAQLEEAVARFPLNADERRELFKTFRRLVDEGLMKKKGRGALESWDDPDAELPPALMREDLADWLANEAMQKHRQTVKDRLEAIEHLLERLGNFRAVQRHCDMALIQTLWETWQTTRRRFFTEHQLATYDSLKETVAAAVSRSPELRQQLAQYWKAGMIDEFQDTDAHQWQLAQALFAQPDRRLFLIGDPKQAIYAFRGADLDTYFRAANSACHRHRLLSNWRSHPDVIAGVNDLFAPEDAFLSDRLRGYPVRPGRETGHRALAGGRWRNGMSLHCLKSDGESPLTGKEVIRDALLRQLQADVTDLLKTARWRDEKGEQAVQPRDIAVLVSSHRSGKAVQAALRAVGVPTVYEGRDSVLGSEAAEALLAVLEAMLHPADGRAVRHALITPLFGVTAEQLRRMNEDVQGGERLAQWMALFEQALWHWQRQGIGPALKRLFHQAGVWTRVAARLDGDRWSADLRHLMEWLPHQARERRLGPHSLVRWLRRTVAQEIERPQEDDLTRMRLERDEAAVRILTVHKSKGLEFPIVFCFDLWEARRYAPPRAPQAIRCDGRLEVHFELNEAQRQAWVRQQRQEALRKAYVAVTRAASLCRIYWARTEKPRSDQWSALGHLLALQRAGEKTGIDALSMRSHWQVTEGAPPETVGRWHRRDGKVAWRTAPDSDFLAERFAASPKLSSYSALVRQQTEEDEDALSEQLLKLAERLAQSADAPQSSDASGLPPGAVAGQLLHDLLERGDFQAFARGEVADELLIPLAQRHGFSPAAVRETVRELLQAAVSRPCLPDGLALKDVPPERMLREAPFMFSVSAERLGRLNALLQGQPGFAPLALDRLHGWLHGFIDLTVQAGDAVHIVDYKSNLLPAYDPPALEEAMASHQYLWQALIYAVAVRRWLRAQAPTLRLGQVIYAFLRGMPEGEGIFVWRPDEALMDAVEACLGGEHVAA